MIHPLPDFPPLFPPGKWWRLFLSRILAGASEREGISFANCECDLRPREWMRVRIAGGAMLSFPIAGGASALKNHSSSSWMMARESTREAARFASTLATVYGRTPFFLLLKDSFFLEICPGGRAQEICEAGFRNVLDILLPHGSETLRSISDELSVPGSRIIEISEESNKNFNPELSIIDALARTGPDAIFPLLPTF